MDSFQQSSTVLTFKPYQESGIRKVETLRHNSIFRQRAIRFNHGVGFSASGSLVIPPGHARPIVADSHRQMCEGFQIGPILAVDSQSRGHKSDDAGLAWLFPRIPLIETAGGSPRLHGTHQAKQQGGHGLLLHGRNGFVEKIFQSRRRQSKSVYLGSNEIENEDFLLAAIGALQFFGFPGKLFR